MGITFHTVDRTVHLQAQDVSYVIQIIRAGYLAHLYFSKKIKQ